MKKLNKIFILTLLPITILLGMIGCSSGDKSDAEYDLTKFEEEIKSKGYEYTRQDIQEGILTPISEYLNLKDSVIVDDKQVILYDTDIIVYSYKNNEEMEKEASNINHDASEITKQGDKILVDWTKTPHFYKKGNIIVQYIGEDFHIISDIEDIMGTQFAGS